jgi:lipoprotein NlpD
MRIWIIALCLGLVACGPRSHFAPVTELSWRENHYQSFYHRVRSGETLYAVAFRYDQDYQQLARYNHLRPPYSIWVGQRLRLVPPQSRRVSMGTPKAYVHSYHRMPRQPAGKNNFIWPLHGRILTKFSPERGKKGIDILGPAGAKVKAAARGVIAYAGGGLVGYGNLVIIKHDNQFLTAYGNNAKYFVKEGQHVIAGQVIGEVGRLDRKYWGLHFEIRHAGKPVNPLIYMRR